MDSFYETFMELSFLVFSESTSSKRLEEAVGTSVHFAKFLKSLRSLHFMNRFTLVHGELDFIFKIASYFKKSRHLLKENSTVPKYFFPVCLRPTHVDADNVEAVRCLISRNVGLLASSGGEASWRTQDETRTANWFRATPRPSSPPPSPYAAERWKHLALYATRPPTSDSSTTYTERGLLYYPFDGSYVVPDASSIAQAASGRKSTSIGPDGSPTIEKFDVFMCKFLDK